MSVQGFTSGSSTRAMGPRRRGSGQLMGRPPHPLTRPPCTCEGRGRAAPPSAPGSLGSKTGAGSVAGGSGGAHPVSGTAASLPPLPTRRPSPDPRPVCPEYTLSLALCKLPPAACGSGDTSLTESTQRWLHGSQHAGEGPLDRLRCLFLRRGESLRQKDGDPALSWAPRNARSPTCLTRGEQYKPQCPAGFVRATKLPPFSRG